MHFRDFALCALFAGAVIAGAAPAGAQTFKSLGCKDVDQGLGRLCLQARVTYRKIDINLVDNKWTYLSHFNLRSSCFNGQTEVQVNKTVTFNAPSRKGVCTVSAQSCGGGGGSRSICSSWVKWEVLAPESITITKQCKGSFCVKVEVDQTIIKVELTKWPASTHRNIRFPNGKGGIAQTEGQVVIFPVKRGQAQIVSVQACNRGGVLQRSGCSSWTTFEVDRQAPPLG
jgi:hypothetical protein